MGNLVKANLVAHLLFKLGEELNEAGQAAMKIGRFSNDGNYPNGIGNVEQLREELSHVLAAVEMLDAAGVSLDGVDGFRNPVRIERAKERFESFLPLSRDRGTLVDPPEPNFDRFGYPSDDTISKIFDPFGYPSDDTISKIEAWPQDKPAELVDFIIQAWDCSYGKAWYTASPEAAERVRGSLTLVTGGWSGNEEVIGAFYRASIFRRFSVKSEPGGKYTIYPPELPAGGAT